MGLRCCIYDNLLIVYGDMLFDTPSIDIDTSNSCIVIDKHEKLRDKKVGVTVNEKNQVENFNYCLKLKWCDIIYIHKRHSLIFRRQVHNNKYYNCYLHEILNKMIDQKLTLRVHEATDNILEIDSRKDI